MIMSSSVSLVESSTRAIIRLNHGRSSTRVRPCSRVVYKKKTEQSICNSCIHVTHAYMCVCVCVFTVHLFSVSFLHLPLLFPNSGEEETISSSSSSPPSPRNLVLERTSDCPLLIDAASLSRSENLSPEYSPFAFSCGTIIAPNFRVSGALQVLV